MPKTPVVIAQGDCLEIMPKLKADSFDSIVSDPPYGLEFMGKEWDAPWKKRGENPAGAKFSTGGFKTGNGYANRKTPTYGKAWSNKRCVKCGHIASGGSPCQCPDPEWVMEYGDTAAPMRGFQEWVTEWASTARRVLKPGAYMLVMGGSRTYHRLACAVEDAGFEIRDCLMWIYGSGFPKAKSCLKPAYEPILLCRKPGKGMRELGIDECRISIADGDGWDVPQPEGGTGDIYGFKNGIGRTDERATPHASGRWPANVLHDGSEEVMEAFAVSGNRYSASAKYGSDSGSNSLFGAGSRGDRKPTTASDDNGSAARFFYTAKASKSERGAGNLHPTVKPLALMEWLVKLVTPKGGITLDPFAGSGTTGVACRNTGRNCVLIEREPVYCEIIRKRVFNGGK